MFRKVAEAVTIWAGSPTAVIGSILIVVVWAVTGPMFGFSDTWQLVINTTTTILTFNMVFLIQATQNRTDKAVHTKLDELLRVTRARNTVIDIEDADEAELDALREQLKEAKNG